MIPVARREPSLIRFPVSAMFSAVSLALDVTARAALALSLACSLEGLVAAKEVDTGLPDRLLF